MVISMITSLRNNLNRKLSEQNLSVGALERHAGLKKGSVQNILGGRSLKPNIELVSAIAEEFGCTVDSLIADKEKDDGVFGCQGAPESETNSVWHLDALQEIVPIVLQCLDKGATETITRTELLTLLTEIYNYTMQTEMKVVDKTFISWLVEKTFHNKQKL